MSSQLICDQCGEVIDPDAHGDPCLLIVEGEHVHVHGEKLHCYDAFKRSLDAV